MDEPVDAATTPQGVHRAVVVEDCRRVQNECTVETACDRATDVAHTDAVTQVRTRPLLQDRHKSGAVGVVRGSGPEEDVIVVAAVEQVAVQSTDQDVAAMVAKEGVVAGVADEDVGGCAAGETIAAGSAEDVLDVADSARAAGGAGGEIHGDAAGEGGIIQAVFSGVAVDGSRDARATRN